MDKARLYPKRKIGGKVYAHEIDDEPWWRVQKTPLICAFCMTPVVSQRASVGRSSRGALFRLAQDQLHEDICPLNPVEVLQKIARGSQGVATMEGDELHLVLPDGLAQISATTPVVDTDPAGANDRVGVTVATGPPDLPPLINSAVVIARLLQKYDYDTAVVAQFKVRRPGEKNAVTWGEFCHGPDPGDHARLYARLALGSEPRHPVAVYGRITKTVKDTQGRPVLRLADGNGFTVVIRSQHASLLDPLPAGAFVLSVGRWKIWTPRTGRPELQLFAEEHWQLAHWTYDPATGHSSPPTHPPPLSFAQRTLRQTREAAAARKTGPGKAARPAPKPPRPSAPNTPTAPPPAASPSPPTAPSPPVFPDPPPPASGPGPAVPDAAPPPPEQPRFPPRPSVPPRPAAPPRRRARRGWWPFGRRR